MLNRYPYWKYLIILAVLLPGFLYALPNLYGEAPAVQISPTRAAKVDTALVSRIDQTLKQAGIPFIATSIDGTSARVRFADEEEQLRAREALHLALGEDFIVALNLQPATPHWLQELNASPMYLGLDLRGGVHFLMEVDVQGAVNGALNRTTQDVKAQLRAARIRYRSVDLQGGVIRMVFRDAETREKAESGLRKDLGTLAYTSSDEGTDFILAATLPEAERQNVAEYAMQQNMTSLRSRVNELGVAEPIIQQQGSRRIVVQLPGVQDTARAKEILGKTATLEVYLVDEKHDYAATRRVPAGSRLYKMRRGGNILLQRELVYSGNNVVNAAAGIDNQSGGAVVHITLDSFGAKRNSKFTGPNIGKRMAVVYVENRSVARRGADGNLLKDEHGNLIKEKKVFEEVITAPVIRDQLGARFQIEGLDSTKEARDLSLLLRAGALAAPLEIIEERTVGPSLGRDNIAQGFQSVLIGFLVVLVFMGVYYRAFGMVANLALALNLVLIVAVLSLFQATLTLPGVAGIVLTVGMAVDANVLIFERIREELSNGNTPQAAIHTGYDRALSTIVDANITTLIA
ncbi:MAG: protein translocase subunit SecD, partial [Gammaproteobacteria bacterium]|nr:protein translocase subunit SecD [Gammaproteobacteria bacterium]